MKSNDTFRGNDVRLSRILRVIWIIRISMWLSLVALAVAILFIFTGPQKAGLWPFSKYPSVHAMPWMVLILGFAKLALFFAGIFVLNRLLRVYANGNFFTSANITCIKWLGYLVIGDWLVGKFIDAVAFRDVVIGFGDLTKPAIGLLIILIAWIMDEGRKIKEEQELTV